jgi:hypothetical protein
MVVLCVHRCITCRGHLHSQTPSGICPCFAANVCLWACTSICTDEDVKFCGSLEMDMRRLLAMAQCVMAQCVMVHFVR